MRISDWSSDVCSSDLLFADEFRRHIIGDGRAPVMAVADIFGQAGAAQILALRHIFHLRRDDAAPGIVHLGDVRSSLGAQRSEERRVGKECVSTCRSRWSPYH